MAWLALLSPAVAAATECRQENAVYGDAAAAYELAFSAVDPDSSASSHRFTVKVLKTNLALDGHVMASEPVNRTNGILFNNCPEGDVTGEDIAACTVWEGVIYGHRNGKIDLLPGQGAEAAPEILLAGLGPSLQASSAWGEKKATVVPWDVFSLKGCGK
ncbi:hypothetical protein JJB09_18790 [Rhizobium sp. KVB221]|uniref:Uncharacterized protein n=1 Tax=Rhizobium setariae TaxID=2801340 RepID=A0A936YQZ3_9HYPH|nr:hypothetical protein [Rhizobium setariae]MBL0374073.1 hypothetical protein [Rhizobium setariae]